MTVSGSLPVNRSGFFEFDPLDRIYRSHFPARAVVPGVLIIRSFVEQLGGGPGPDRFSIDVFGFERFAAPGRYEFKIIEEDGHYLCWLGKDGITYAKGKISICA